MADQADSKEVELVVRVSNRDGNGVSGYGFAYAGKPVIMRQGKGEFTAIKGKSRLLEWGMIGEPGGWMTVEVLDGETVIKKREKSEIVPPFRKGYDAFAIVLP